MSQLTSLLAGVKPHLRRLRYGFLLMPGAVAAALLGLAFLLVRLDRASGRDGLGFGLANDAEAARAVLSVIAGSLITVAGVAFSITMVTLQLVSQQFSPRLLRGFLGDRLNQMVAGVFVGVFIYCLIVLRTVAGPDAGEPPFVPALSVTVAIVLSVVALGLLLVFIDHTMRNIQVSGVAGSIARATLTTLGSLYPEPYGRPAGDDREGELARWSRRGPPRLVRPRRAGYVQSVTFDDIPRHVGSPGLRIDMRVAPGDFVTGRTPIAAFWPGEDDGDLARALSLAVVIADERDMRQDPGYGMRQLADIATRAISPGVNDPSTAWTCIRHLQEVMEVLVTLPTPDRVRRYDDVDVTVVAVRTSFAAFVEVAYAQIGRYAGDPRIGGVLLEGIRDVMEEALRAGADDRIEPLVLAARRVARTTGADGTDEADRAVVADLLAAIESLGRREPAPAA